MEKKSILDPMPFTVDDFFTTQAQRDDAEKKDKKKWENLHKERLIHFLSH